MKSVFDAACVLTPFRALARCFQKGVARRVGEGHSRRDLFKLLGAAAVAAPVVAETASVPASAARVVIFKRKIEEVRAIGIERNMVAVWGDPEEFMKSAAKYLKSRSAAFPPFGNDLVRRSATTEDTAS